MDSPKDLDTPGSASSIGRKKDILELKNELGPKYVIFMVGLPARGKSYICKKLCRYLSWCGFKTKVFNVGNKRRMDVSKTVSGECNTHDSKFFDHTNAAANAQREQLAMDTLEEILSWLKCGGGKIGIHDATNSTFERRSMLRQRVVAEYGIKPIFIESICPDPEVLERNIQMKLNGPDYIGMDPIRAQEDFKERIRNYEKVYQTLGEEEEKLGYSYIKIIDVGSKVIANRIKGYLPSQCVFYLMQMNIVSRSIWLSVHGESLNGAQHRIGGDPPLSAKGVEYSQALFKFIHERELKKPNGAVDDSMVDIAGSPKLRILASTLQRAVQTVAPFEEAHYDISYANFLREINFGLLEGSHTDDFHQTYPQQYQELLNNPLSCRYPGLGGESLLDVIERLRPVIIELERMRVDIMVVTHRMLMRTLLAYFVGIKLEDIPRINVPMHTLYKIDPKPYGADVTRYGYNEETKSFELLGEGVGYVENKH